MSEVFDPTPKLRASRRRRRYRIAAILLTIGWLLYVAAAGFDPVRYPYWPIAAIAMGAVWAIGRYQEIEINENLSE